MAPQLRVPQTWTDNDRRLYIKIALRKQYEHALGYATIGIGCQLFYNLTNKQAKASTN